jgi:hypothetical protein
VLHLQLVSPPASPAMELCRELWATDASRALPGETLFKDDEMTARGPLGGPEVMQSSIDIMSYVVRLFRATKLVLTCSDCK